MEAACDGLLLIVKACGVEAIHQRDLNEAERLRMMMSGGHIWHWVAKFAKASDLSYYQKGAKNPRNP